MELKFILESLLFSAQKPLSRERTARRFRHGRRGTEDADATVEALKKVKEDGFTAALEELAQEHETAARSYRLVCVAGSWQFVTQPEFAPWLKALVGVKARPSRLSQPALETLAIIAYRQPITRAEVEQIRGVQRGRHDANACWNADWSSKPVAPKSSAALRSTARRRCSSNILACASLEDLPAADELRRIPIEKPHAPLTADPGLATSAPPELKLEEAAEKTEGA